jgi:hypothetical protein
MGACTLQEGLVLEFGVYYGKSLRHIASSFPGQTVHGFDSFNGLPEVRPQRTRFSECFVFIVVPRIGACLLLVVRIPRKVSSPATCPSIRAFMWDYSRTRSQHSWKRIRFMFVDCDPPKTSLTICGPVLFLVPSLCLMSTSFSGSGGTVSLKRSKRLLQRMDGATSTLPSV